MPWREYSYYLARAVQLGLPALVLVGLVAGARWH